MNSGQYQKDQSAVMSSLEWADSRLHQTSGCLYYLSVMSSHMSGIVRITAGTDARLFVSHYAMKVFSSLGWQTGNTTRVIPIIVTVHGFIGCWGGGSGLSIMATAAEALCVMLPVFCLEKKIKKDHWPVPVSHKERNRVRLSFTQSWRQECDKTRCSSPLPRLGVLCHPIVQRQDKHRRCRSGCLARWQMQTKFWHPRL